MPELCVPVFRARSSFLTAMAEFADEGRAGDSSMVGADLENYGTTWHTDAGFAAYLSDVVAEAVSPRMKGWVPSTTLWWLDGDEYLGRIAVRHELTDFLLESGGHIGYDVRRSRRREGHATAMLHAVLPEARGLGIERALVTCDETNLASRKVIEAAGGALEDQRGAKLRYWVPTGD